MAGSYGLSAFEHRMRGLTRGDANQATTAEALAGMQAELDRSADLLRAILQAQAA